MDHEFVERVLRATALGENMDTMFWRVDGEYAPITFLVLCNDEFWWACADCEALTPGNIDVFEQAMRDVYDVTAKHDEKGRGSYIYGSTLFCARVRKMRPQGAAYPGDGRYAGVRALLDAAGPPRDVDLHNPKAAPAAASPPPPP